MKGRVYIDYDPIRIIWPNPKKSQEVTDAMADKAGLSGTFYVVEPKDFPNTREDRREWEYDVSSKKVTPNQVKVKAKKDKEKAANESKDRVKAKLKQLGINDEDISVLVKG